MFHQLLSIRFAGLGAMGGTAALFSMLLAGCSVAETPASDPSSSPVAAVDVQITPVLVNIENPPVPFVGSDGQTRLTYELELTNFSSGSSIIKRVEVLNSETGATLNDMDLTEIGDALQPFGGSRPTDDDVANVAGSTSSADDDLAATIPGAASSLLFVDIVLESGVGIPSQISHRVTAHVESAPPGAERIVRDVPPIKVDERYVAVGQNPMRGEGFISADSCCDAHRHRRAALSINNEVWLAQRFAVDWEQVDADGRIYQGEQGTLSSYAIYGEEIYAFSDATVVASVDDLPEQVPPNVKDVNLQTADGNHVVLDLGDGSYALYAHMIPGSVAVRTGDQVTAGQVLGKVGNSGNSIAPHLHFHVMSTPSPLASNGLPYGLASFNVTGQVAGETPTERTEAFDAAEADGTALPVATAPVSGERKNEFPLDQLIITMN